MGLNELFDSFLREKRYLGNLSERTLRYLKGCLKSYKRVSEELPCKQKLNEWIILLRESGITASGINSYIRGFNSFLSWLHENEHLTERLKIKPLKEPQKVLKVFSDSQLKSLLSWKPVGFYEQRLYTLIVFIIDTGCRIDECLSLKRSGVDIENLLVTVRGKGNKERIIPISLECRKVLFRFIDKHDSELVFPTKQGARYSYRNSVRDFKDLCTRLGITEVRTSWHTLRHGFAINHVRQGGDVFSLQRMLGHSSLEVTKRYVNLTEDDLKMVHRKTSILGRLK